MTEGFAGRRRVVVDRFGGPEVMRTITDEVPPPGPGHVMVRVEAAGAAYSDVLMRGGRYPSGPRPPYVPGWDVAGGIEAVGAGVPAYWLGRRVVSLVLTGGYTSHLSVPVDNVVVLPAGVDLLAAACLPLNYVTAYELLHRVAKVRPSDRILVHGAAGGVGTALLDLALRAGAETCGAASTRKGGVVTAFGAEFVDSTTADLDRLCRTGGFDVVFDPFGGGSLRRSFRALRQGGQLVSYGFSAVARTGSPTVPVLRQLVRLRALSLLPNGRRATFYRLSAGIRADPERIRTTLVALVRQLATGRLSPLVGEVIQLDRAPLAHQLLESSQVRGKVLLVP